MGTRSLTFSREARLRCATNQWPAVPDDGSKDLVDFDFTIYSLYATSTHIYRQYVAAITSTFPQDSSVASTSYETIGEVVCQQRWLQEARFEVRILLGLPQHGQWLSRVHGADIRGAHRADDLIPEESEDVQRALKRLSPKESYDRVFRMRRAFQVRALYGRHGTSILTVDTVLAHTHIAAKGRVDHRRERMANEVQYQDTADSYRMYDT